NDDTVAPEHRLVGGHEIENFALNPGIAEHLCYTIYQIVIFTGHRRSPSVFLPFGVCAYVFRRHQSRIVTVRVQLAAQVMRADTGFHADQARWHVAEPRFDLAA